MNEKLKPCPFCGGIPVIYNYPSAWCVICKDCRFDGPTDLGWSGAIELWNTRPREEILISTIKSLMGEAITQDAFADDEGRSLLDSAQLILDGGA